MYCEHCGTENTRQAKFCKSCGASLKQSNEITVKKKRKKGIFLVLFAVIILVVAAGYVVLQYLKKAKEIQNNIQAGQKYLDEKEYEEAEECFQKVIKSDPGEMKAYQGLAEIYEEMEEYEKALEMYEDAFAQAKTPSEEMKRKEEELALRAEKFYEEQEKKQIVVDELEEGYYSKEAPKENISVSLIKDYQEIMCATIEYSRGDSSEQVYFEWKDGNFCQITSTEDDAYEIFLEQDGTDLVLSLKKEGENIFEEVILQKRKYLNYTNAILGLKNYLEEKKFTMLSDTETYVLPTNENRSLYNEMIQIPIKRAGEKETAYYALVTTKAFEESGYVAIYSEEDMKEITAEDSFLGKEPLEEFSIYEYYEFE